ncbi:MAG TPA: hypothetical protein PLY42_18220, partial [Nitrospira sp.]|nr:hypothetical protein [Nitrospira sp.]
MEQGRIHGLGQHRVHAGVQAGPPVVGEGIGGQGDDRGGGMGRHLADAAGGLQPVHLRHLH